LVDRNILTKIVEAGEIAPSDLVLEIGAGAGTLTLELAARAAWVKAVEVDHGLAKLLREVTSSLDNVEIIPADFLKLDLAFELSPGSFPVPGEGAVKVIANPPYSIGGEILIKLLCFSGNLERMILTLPKDVGARVVSPPGGKDYGLLSVFAGMFSRPEILFPVSRWCFFPVPKVDSVAIRFKIVPGGRYRLADPVLWKTVVKAAFGGRRKTLKNALAALSSLGYTTSLVLQACRLAEIDPGSRAETIPVEGFARLSDALSELSGVKTDG